MSHNNHKQKPETLLDLLVRVQRGVNKMRRDLSPAVGDIFEDTRTKATKLGSKPEQFLLVLLMTIRVIALGVSYINKQLGREIGTSLQKKNLRRAKIIKPPPGSRLLAIADFFCSQQTMNLAVLPTVADWRKEYYVALNHQRSWKARWISVRYYFRFIKILGLDKVLSLLKSFSSAR